MLAIVSDFAMTQYFWKFSSHNFILSLEHLSILLFYCGHKLIKTHEDFYRNIGHFAYFTNYQEICTTNKKYKTFLKNSDFT